MWPNEVVMGFQCKVCVKTYNKEQRLISHKKRAHGIFTCSCKKTSKSERAMSRHKQKVHEIFTCKICQRLFKKKERFIIHKHRFHGTFECEVCKKIFKSQRWLSSHKVRCNQNDISGNDTPMFDETQTDVSSEEKIQIDESNLEGVTNLERL